MLITPTYNQQPLKELISGGIAISSFVIENEINSDQKTVVSFGEEWNKFHSFSDDELSNAGLEYFDIITDSMMHSASIVLDMGCGSGRWTKFIAEKVAYVEAIDPSTSVLAASQSLSSYSNVRVTQASSDNIPFPDNTFDFLICLGVLHHIPDTQKALCDAGTKVKSGGYALLYFYYNLENRGAFYKLIFSIVNLIRLLISKLPKTIKKISCDIIAVFIYLPLVILTRIIKLFSPNEKLYKKIPLSYYSNKSFRIMRNDALDRFGTPLEQRFSKKEIMNMCQKAGFTNIIFSDQQPYWHCVAQKV